MLYSCHQLKVEIEKIRNKKSKIKQQVKLSFCLVSNCEITSLSHLNSLRIAIWNAHQNGHQTKRQLKKQRSFSYALFENGNVLGDEFIIFSQFIYFIQSWTKKKNFIFTSATSQSIKTRCKLIYKNLMISLYLICIQLIHYSYL